MVCDDLVIQHVNSGGLGAGQNMSFCIITGPPTHSVGGPD